MAIIHITRQTLIAPESAYQKTESGVTIMDQIVLPRQAGHIAGFALPDRGIVRRAIHASFDTYRFLHGEQQWRAHAPTILSAHDGMHLMEHRDALHFGACLLCRNGGWCNVGITIIEQAIQNGAQV